MTQSVDVNALFDRLALLVTGGVSGPTNGIDIAALDARVGVNATASLVATGLFARIIALEDGVVNTDNPDNPDNTYIDSASFVVTDASPSDVGEAWDAPGRNYFKEVDPAYEDSARYLVDKDVGYAYVDFEAGSLIDISGFEMKPWQFGTGEFVYPMPLTTRLMARLSTTDPWITIGTLTVDAQPEPYTMLSYQTSFEPVSYRYFRFEFVYTETMSASDAYEILYLKLIAT